MKYRASSSCSKYKHDIYHRNGWLIILVPIIYYAIFKPIVIHA